jgi:hypothetical protein
MVVCYICLGNDVMCLVDSIERAHAYGMAADMALAKAVSLVSESV